MKINFLGTSAGWPLPRLGCTCNVCTSKDHKDTRTRTQLLINDTILLDAGPDTYEHLIKKNPQNIEAVFISHQHPDHTIGLWDLSHIYNQKNHPVLYVTLPVFDGIKKTINVSSNLLKLKIKIIKENQTVHLGNCKIMYFPVIHGKTPAYGIKVKESKILAYIPDFNRIIPTSQKIIKDCDILAIDGSTLGKIGQSPSHISINDGIKIAQKMLAKQTYFVHIGHKTGRHEFLENYLRRNAGINFHISYDGKELTA
ncbi:hypothetical protein A3F02_03075 [Candidatus Curtissbacteria bacterium RIFCSPHIGHO2_12_FULL_38_9b]|uniref:Metallo-beta-lactamase domain-containing protein n=2 Tax=Candidatus Curtissiibacteriota TaxID=1752717 RepID=A0A1F5GZB5_9BACT|nr:MAG: hypothetical protein A3A48_00945 [Candidatus Curtissbacteria bacterium RIFCSPLOWO2_01_FULL_37_9]OGD97155.1 MAG: hypothetical protein A3F02_03075 [Candidatus Curtissbacteria bacterium RIFCSPHIGHO2_12_FULL_38_9b]